MLFRSLTGRFTSNEDLPDGDFRKISPRFSEENFELNRKLVRMIEDLAKDKNATPAQIALQWVLAKGDDIVPIPGTKRISYLEDNLGALNVTLSSSEIDALDAAFPLGVAKGDRYPAAAMAAVNL